ncbi:Rz1-like lysis system protein LysC [Zavarzinia aquatilis]|uniref:Rz1-like lysis system protein LysC n=1 Tax=Zavarzinia aquatilis TaxID=2211142 RepID=UPI003C6FEE4B
MPSAAGSRLPLALALASTALLSAGCSTTSAPAPQVIVPEIPASLLTCSPEPAPPAADADDAGLALWIVELRRAGQDCRSRLSGVRVWADQMRQPGG